MLDRRVDRPHARSRDQKSDSGSYITLQRQRYKYDSHKFKCDPEPDQHPVAKPVGDKTGDQPPQHKSSKDQRPEGSDKSFAHPGFCSGKITRRPEKTCHFSGTISKEGDQCKDHSVDFYRLSDPCGFFHILSLSVFRVFPERQGKDTDHKDSNLDIRCPAVSFIPVRILQRKAHDIRTDDRTQAVKTMQEIHYR